MSDCPGKRLRSRGRRSLFFLIIIVLLPPSVFAFEIPEHLEYELRWTGIKAGAASLEVKNDGDRMRITSSASSAKWVDVLYTVRDRVEVLTDRTFRGINYRIRIREGGYRRDREYIFERDKGKATYVDHVKGEREGFAVPEEVYDPLAAFYRVREMALTVGESVYVPVFDNKKLWTVEVQVLRKEKVRTPAGVFDAVVIKPIMKSEGIFLRKGDVYIWLTDDARKMPVKLRSRVKVGSIDALLTGINQPPVLRQD